MSLEFRNSVIMLEGYPTSRVTELQSNSTAFPDRDGQILLSPVLTWPKNTTLDGIAWAIWDRLRDTALEGTDGRLKAYVNYAKGGGEYGRAVWI